MWRRAKACNGSSSCVEVAEMPDGSVRMRDSKNPNSPELRFTPEEWAAFMAGVRAGEFDV